MVSWSAKNNNDTNINGRYLSICPRHDHFKKMRKMNMQQMLWNIETSSMVLCNRILMSIEIKIFHALNTTAAAVSMAAAVTRPVVASSN